MSSSLFYQKYRRLFFEDDQEPLAYQIFHSHPTAAAVSDLPQWLAASPPRVTEKLPKMQSKVKLPPIEYSPPAQSRKVLHPAIVVFRGKGFAIDGGDGFRALTREERKGA